MLWQAGVKYIISSQNTTKAIDYSQHALAKDVFLVNSGMVIFGGIVLLLMDSSIIIYSEYLLRYLECVVDSVRDGATAAVHITW